MYNETLARDFARALLAVSEERRKDVWALAQLLAGAIEDELKDELRDFADECVSEIERQCDK